MAEGEARIRGWGCTPTGEVPAAAVTSSRNEQPPGCLPAQMTRGWRRSTLYLILALLMLTIFINLALTLWIIATLRLSMVSLLFLKYLTSAFRIYKISTSFPIFRLIILALLYIVITLQIHTFLSKYLIPFVIKKNINILLLVFQSITE